MNLSSKTRVAVLRGGPSDGYESSLKTGEHILATLRNMSDVYEPLDIFISKAGEWHREGWVYEPHHALKQVDVVWNALHGFYGEDGQVQKILEGLKIPFIGSSATASALAMNQDMAKHLYEKHSLSTPMYEIVSRDSLNEDRLVKIFRAYLPPIVVKPIRHIDVVYRAFTYEELKALIRKALALSPRVLIEEFIRGTNATCTVIENAREEKIYALLPTPSRLGEAGKRIEEMAKQAHRALGLSYYSSSHFLVTPQKKIYILNTRSSPEFHEDSLTYHMLRATGWRSRDFVDHVLKLAMR